jgi:hypothetical protein
MNNRVVVPHCEGQPRSHCTEPKSRERLVSPNRGHTVSQHLVKPASAGPDKPGTSRSTLHDGRRQREMPAEGEPIGSCGGAPQETSRYIQGRARHPKEPTLIHTLCACFFISFASAYAIANVYVCGCAIVHLSDIYPTIASYYPHVVTDFVFLHSIGRIYMRPVECIVLLPITGRFTLSVIPPVFYKLPRAATVDMAIRAIRGNGQVLVRSADFMLAL